MRLLTIELLTRLNAVQIPSRKRVRAPDRGERPSLRKGSSLEFSDYREYLQGDDIRSIDWNVYARTERLFLKLFLEEESRPVYFVVDCSKSMEFGDPSKLEYALSLAAALSYASLCKYDRPHLLLVRDRSYRKLAFHSLQTFFLTLQELEKQHAAGETYFSAALKKIALGRFPKGIYFLLSDFYSLDGIEGMKLLAGSGNELHCLQILTPEETNPGFRGDLRLIDSETSDHSEVSISPRMLKGYLARLRDFQLELRTAAHRSFAHYYSILTSTPLDSLIFLDLRKQGIVV